MGSPPCAFSNALIFTDAPPAAVQLQPGPAGGEQAPSGLSAAEVFALAERLALQGRMQDAEHLLTGLVQDPSLDYRSEARFRLGRLRAAQGDLKGAIRWYRLLLEEKPDAVAVRLELARTLALADEEPAARRELRRANAIGLPDDVLQAVDRFALALRSRRRLGGAVELAIAPDSNINRATDAEEIGTVLGPLTPDEDAQARSGIGLALAAQGFWRSDNGRSPLLVRISGKGDFYSRGRFNDLAVSAAAGPELRRGSTRWRPAVTFTQRWFGGEAYSRHAGASLNWLRPLSRTSQMEVEVTVLRGRYRGNPDQNGTTYDLAADYERAVGQNLSFRGSGRFTRTNSRDAALSTTSAGFGGLVARRLGSQTLFGQATLSGLSADAASAFFGKRREDVRIDITAGLLLNRWRLGDLSPVIRIKQVFNRSSLDIYRFGQTRLEFGLSKEF